jgi:hypothetical protein
MQIKAAMFFRSGDASMAANQHCKKMVESLMLPAAKASSNCHVINTLNMSQTV